MRSWSVHDDGAERTLVSLVASNDRHVLLVHTLRPRIEPISATQSQLPEFLLNVVAARPVLISGAPGIGKSSPVRYFAERLGLDGVSHLGSQLAPDGLIGVPQTPKARS